jgi:hypothetical protein
MAVLLSEHNRARSRPQLKDGLRRGTTLQPDPDTILATSDAPTLRLLKALEVQEDLTAEQVLLADFTRLIGLRNFMTQ